MRLTATDALMSSWEYSQLLYVLFILSAPGQTLRSHSASLPAFVSYTPNSDRPAEGLSAR
jgi:hypothetical protein